jgi:hypothetical protein
VNRVVEETLCICIISHQAFMRPYDVVKNDMKRFVELTKAVFQKAAQNCIHKYTISPTAPWPQLQFGQRLYDGGM